MSDIQRSLGSTKLSQVATHARMSARIHLFQRKSMAVFAEECVD